MKNTIYYHPAPADVLGDVSELSDEQIASLLHDYELSALLMLQLTFPEHEVESKPGNGMRTFTLLEDDHDLWLSVADAIDNHFEEWIKEIER